jgi:hypothetical protein
MVSFIIIIISLFSFYHISKIGLLIHHFMIKKMLNFIL